MDRSLLSRSEVAVASRGFVCIRLATYESAEEAEFLAKLYKSRSGKLENTVFAVLDPTGKKQLIRASRGANQRYRSASAMASGLKEIAAQYPDKKQPGTDEILPLMRTVDLGLNVASCDSLPVVLTYAKSDEELQKLNESLRKFAWSKDLGGQFVYVSTKKSRHLKPISGMKDQAGIVVVSPGEFGLTGDVLAQFDTDTDLKKVETKLREVAATYPRKVKNRTAHTSLGIELGIDWQTVIPPTDEQSNRAKERRRGK